MRLKRVNYTLIRDSQSDDIVANKDYLVKIGGRFYAGPFALDWFGWRFTNFNQYGMALNSKSITEVYEIIEEDEVSTNDLNNNLTQLVTALQKAGEAAVDGLKNFFSPLVPTEEPVNTEENPESEVSDAPPGMRIGENKHIQTRHVRPGYVIWLHGNLYKITSKDRIFGDLNEETYQQPGEVVYLLHIERENKFEDPYTNHGTGAEIEEPNVILRGPHEHLFVSHRYLA